MLPRDPFRKTDRIDEVTFGALFVAAGAFFGFFGIRGAVLYFGGSREAPADPLAWGLGILACLGLSYLGIRLVMGKRRSGPLLSNLLLLLGGSGAIAGTIWMLVLNHQIHGSVWDDIRTVTIAGGAGVCALVLWWRRVHSQSSRG